MTSINDYSDEPRFSIKTVCTQTGIRPVTLRAWERRHNVLQPHRSQNRYRLYSERDVAILHWLKNRIENNIAISTAAQELNSLLKSGFFPEPVTGSPPSLPVRLDTPPEQYASNLYQALINHDEARAGELLREAQVGYELNTLLHQVITAALVKIGDDWYHGRIGITIEHFASTFIRGKLLTLLQSYPTRRNASYLLVGCAPAEQHEISSLMFSVMLRSAGYRVEYLGPDIPVDDLVEYSADVKPDMVVLVASMEEPARELTHVQSKLARLKPAPVFGYGGQIFITKPELRKIVPGNYLGDSMEHALTDVRRLLDTRKTSRH